MPDASAKRPFNKPATTYTEQISLLRSRGMEIADEKEAAHFLEHLNYYRLGAYWLPFEADHASHRFRPGTKFHRVVEHYIFDRMLRLLVMDSIERIEVSVRSLWAYHLAHQHGPHAHLDEALAQKPQYWLSNLESLKKEVQRADEVFIRHLTATYCEALPPVWAVCEVMSLGSLSRWYAALKPMKTRQAIASTYGVDEGTLQSWLHHLSVVRNHCAHHSRLWNREFTVTPGRPRTKPASVASDWATGSRRLYNTLLVLDHLESVISPGNSFHLRFVELVNRQNIDVRQMGFPASWKDSGSWFKRAEN